MRDFSAFVDGKLDDDRKVEVRVHLDECEPCLRHLAAYRRGLAIYRDGSDEDVPIDFYERIRTRLAEDGAVPAYAIPVAEERAAPMMSTAPLWAGSRLGGVVAAVVVAFLVVLAITPDIQDVDRDRVVRSSTASIAGIVPRLETDMPTLEAPRAEVVRVAIADNRQRVARSAVSDASEWPIAEVERLDVTPHPWIVQAAFSLP